MKNAIDSVGDRMRKKLWVGVLGTQTNKYDDALRANIDNKMRTEANSVPVWIPDAEFEKCYDEFCHQVSSDVYYDVTRALKLNILVFPFS